MSMNDLSCRIRDAREAKGWSQRDLAAKMEVSQQTVAHWEQGGVPRGRRLDRLSEVLGTNLLGASSESQQVGFMSYLVTEDTGPRFSRRANVDAKGMFIDHSRERPPVDEKTQANIELLMNRIRDIHGERQSGERPLQMTPQAFQELRHLRDEAFKLSLALQSANGRLEARLPGAPDNRRYDYLSDTVVAELVAFSGSDPRLFSPMRYTPGMVRLAAAKATQPNLQAVLVIVVETGDIEQFRAMAERMLNFDCQALRVTLRVVSSYLEAAEAIVNLELVAPLLAKMDASEEDDSFLAEGSVGLPPDA